MDIEQQHLAVPPSNVMLHIRSGEGTVEWELRTFWYETKRWDLADAGSTSTWAEACAEAARSVDYLADGRF